MSSSSFKLDRRQLIVGAAAVAGAAALPGTAWAPQFARALDVYQGFNFKKDKQTGVGFVQGLNIGSVVLKPDLDVFHPVAGQSGKVVAVLSHILWDTGVTDAFYLHGQISQANKTSLNALLLGGKVDTTTLFQFVIAEYDPIRKKYFQAMFSDAPLKGLIEKNGSELNLAVADDRSHEVQSPVNFTFKVGIKPAAGVKQQVTIAIGDGKNVVKPWGV